MKKLLLDRYHFYKTLPIDKKREWNTLFIIYPFAAIMLILYFFKYNFYYHVSEYNNYFFILGGLLIAIVSLGLISKRKNLAFITYLFALTLAVVFLTFVSGGIRAPGLTWLTLFGPVYGLFFGKKGIFLGIITSILVFIILFYLDKAGLNPNVVLLHANYQTEKNSNFFTFLIFMASNFLAYAIANERASKELKEKNEQIEQFLRILFHDVANPLAVILLSSDNMVRRSNFNEQGVLRIKKAAQNLKEQLESVKKLKAIKDGKYYLEIDNFSIKKMIESSVDIFAEKCEAKNIKIIYGNFDYDLQVKVDSVVFINQIFSNLLSNCIKFSHPNSEIKINVVNEKNTFRISVSDNGIGMPEDIRLHLFEVDKVVSRAGTSQESGSGYGLSLAKHFTESFGGTIEVKSIEESANKSAHGTTFIINLPIL